MKVLFIDANPKTAEYSHSKWASAQYISSLEASGHDIEVWPLYQMNIPMIDEDVISAFNKSMTGLDLSEAEEEKMTLRNELLDKFMTFEHYVVVSPLWNFGIPPQLKALIDVVAVANKTFKYTDKGPLGLLKGSFLHIQASGGIYSTMPDKEFSNRYISQVFGFMGLEEKEALLIEGTNTGGFQREVYQSTLDEWLNHSVKEL